MRYNYYSNEGISRRAEARRALIAWHPDEFTDMGLRTYLAKLLGYTGIHEWEKAGLSAADIKHLELISGTNGYFYYRVLQARNLK